MRLRFIVDGFGYSILPHSFRLQYICAVKYFYFYLCFMRTQRITAPDGIGDGDELQAQREHETNDVV